MDDARDMLRLRPEGLYCPAGDFFIDPLRPVERAIVTHGHADHARPNNQHVLATRETLAIMKSRYGGIAKTGSQEAAYGVAQKIGDVTVRLIPAGHVLGSAQVVMEYGGQRVIVSGDYKRRFDATCTPFEVMTCDLYVTEATFGLPVFRHPDDLTEIQKLLSSLSLFPDRPHLVGAYALGKAQRVITLLRRAGYEETIYLHGALVELCTLYTDLGVELGRLEPLSGRSKADFAGKIILCPPSALADKWSRGFGDAVRAFASGWMMVRQRARQRGVELPLVLSDHADWDELTATIEDVAAPIIWVTHGREEALVHYARSIGREADALSIAGFEEDSA